MIDNSPMKPAAECGIQQRWLITFTDLIALLLAFFVMLFAMSAVETEPWEEMTNSLVERLNPDFGWDTLVALTDLDADTTLTDGAVDLDYLQAVLSAKMRNIPMLSKALLTRQTDRLIISLQADSLFTSGSATLSEDARAALYAMGDTLRHVSNQLVVVGHTDPNPVQQGQYASNWELSVHRALVVANALANAGYTRDITAMGLAESQFKDVDTDLDQETRFRNARRVDVIIREIEGGKNND